MASKSGKAGLSTYQMAARRRNMAIFYGVLGIGIIVVIYLLMTNSQQLGLGGGTFLVLLILLRVVPGLLERKMKTKFKEEKRAIRGARAEEKIESILDSLNENYVVLHDIESAYGNIDHLVISQQAGIFMIETKAHGGRVEIVDGALMVNGHAPEKDFIAQSLRNTYWVRDLVEPIIGSKPWITPLLVFTNAFVRGNLKIKGITVLNKKYLLNALNVDRANSPVTNQIWEKRNEIIERITASKKSSK